MSKPQFITQAGLKKRGWTKSMIDNLLGEPDHLGKNPIFKSAAPMRLYEIKRVHAIEKGENFADLKGNADKRRAAITPSIENRRSRTLLEVQRISVRIKKVSLDHLQREAVESYNTFHDLIDPINLHEVKKRNPDFLDRITVNHIRHNRTWYDELLVEQAGKIGVDDAKEIVRAKVYKAIMCKYPELEKECLRQLDDRGCDIGLAA